MILNKIKNAKSKGFSLIEVMVAVVVFSFGLIGVAGMLSTSIHAGQEAYLRTQATALAASMADMLVGNGGGADIAPSYNGDYSGYSDLSGECSVACSATDLSTRNGKSWSNKISQMLPNSNGSVACIDDMCTIRVAWKENDAQPTEEITMVVSP